MDEEFVEVRLNKKDMEVIWAALSFYKMSCRAMDKWGEVEKIEITAKALRENQNKGEKK